MRIHIKPRVSASLSVGMSAPIERARRCLEIWLREEGLNLSRRKRQRAAALIARYFYNEEDLRDRLILSFLRHYSGFRDVDMEDISMVSQEIQATLDEARPALPFFANPRWAMSASFFSALLVVILAAFLLFFRAPSAVVPVGTISRVQQAQLKKMVDGIAVTHPHISRAAIWESVKKPLGIRSYADIPVSRFKEAERILEKRYTLSISRAGATSYK